MTRSPTVLPSAVVPSAAIRHERQRRAIGLATFNISYLAVMWPRILEAVDERDWLRLTGLAMTPVSSAISGIADIRRAPQKVEKDAARHAYLRALAAARRRSSNGRVSLPPRPWNRQEFLFTAIGCAVAAVGGAIQFWYSRRYRSTQSLVRR